MSNTHLRAFSMIEVLSASAIFAAGLAAIFTAFSTSTQQFEHQRHTTHGIHLTEAKMEELLLRVSSDTELIAGSTFGPEWYTDKAFPSATGCPAATSGLPAATPNCRYRVTWSSAEGGIRAVRITTVTTSWNERGVTKSVSFSTQRN